MTEEFKIIHFRDKIIKLKRIPSGAYVDDKGTIYPEALFDPGFCGIGNLETGEWDPFHTVACKPHDVAFQKLKAGYKDPTTSNVKEFTRFTAGVGVGMLKGVYAVVMGVPYMLFGGIGGILRWAYLEGQDANW